MKVKIVTMTAAYAKQLLNANPHNRKMTGYAEVYASDMKEGRWKINGESVIIDTSAFVKDGQHRLHATVLAETFEWQCVLVTDVDPNVMDTIDTGKNRSLGDTLQIEGIANSAQVAAVIQTVQKWDWGYLGYFGNGSPRRVTNTIGLQLYLNRKHMFDALLHRAQNIHKEQTTKLFTITEIALYIYMITKGKGVRNETVFNFLKLLTGIEMDNNSGATWFYKKMLKYSNNNESIGLKYRVAMVIKSWNLYLSGNPDIKSMVYNSNDPMPEIDTLANKFEEG